MLLNAAWARNHGTGMFILPQKSEIDRLKDTLAEVVPGMPPAVLQALDGVTPDTCGRCSAFQNGQCTERGFWVKQTDPACDFFVAQS
jgi:hypothetical protein